jgi:hypothetical protein
MSGLIPCSACAAVTVGSSGAVTAVGIPGKPAVTPGTGPTPSLATAIVASSVNSAAWTGSATPVAAILPARNGTAVPVVVVTGGVTKFTAVDSLLYVAILLGGVIFMLQSSTLIVSVHSLVGYLMTYFM